jgi:hypothetical protein
MISMFDIIASHTAFLLGSYSVCVTHTSVSLHAPLCATSSLVIRLEASIFGGPLTRMYLGPYSLRCAIYI